MKIAKKFMTLALAAALGVGCATVGVGAAPSNTSDLAAVAPSRTSETTVDSEHSSIYEVVKELEKTQGFADLQAKYKDLADAFKPVSYTHLDVYKRQLLNNRNRRNHENGM